MRLKCLMSFFSPMLVLASLTAHADTSAADALAASLASMKTMAGSFEQRISDAKEEQLQLSNGQFKIKRPGQFFWHVAPPYEQVVVGTSSSLKVYDPDLEQMTVHGKDALTGTPAALISGDGSLISKHYHVTSEQGKNQTRFDLAQKQNESGAFDSLQLVFKKQQLVKMIIIDKLDQRTEITLSDVIINSAIADTEFQFDPPKDTDIIIDG